MCMLESKVNLNLQNDFLLNRNASKPKTQPATKNTEKHDKKSKIFWSASAAAALIATVTGGIYYLRRGKGSSELSSIAEEIANFEPFKNIINKKFDFNFGESIFSKFKPKTLETPERIVVNNQESLLTKIIKADADARRTLKFNDDMSFMQVTNGDVVMNIHRPSDGEFTQISELFIGNNNLTPIVNKHGVLTNKLYIDAFRPIRFDAASGEVIVTDMNKSVAQKIVRQFDLDDILDCYELSGGKPIINTLMPSAKSEKLLSWWRHKLDIDSTIDDIATQTGKSKDEVYKIIHSQKFREVVKNQREIIDDGYNEVCETMYNDFGLRPDIEKPLQSYKDVLKAFASRGTVLQGEIRNYVVDGFEMTPKMTDCTHVYNAKFGSDKSVLGGHYTYNSDKSFINYNDDFKSIERYTPKKITDATPKYTTLSSENGGFTLVERESFNELTLVNSNGTNKLKIKYKGKMKNPEIEKAELTSKVSSTHGEKANATTQEIAADNETLQQILRNFSQDMYLSGSAISEKERNIVNSLLSQLL